MIFWEREEQEPSLMDEFGEVSGFGAIGRYLDMISAVFAGFG